MDLFSSLANTFSGLFSGAPPPARQRSPFFARYKAMPMVFSGKDHLDMGNKVIMPPSALARLTRSHVEYPMMFVMVNESTEQKTHVGVLEFSAPEGIAYIPLSVMRSLYLQTEGSVSFSSIVLPRGSFVKIQPHKTTFIELSNPKAVLEKSLRLFSCLTTGETFLISHAGQEFEIDVIEVKPNLLEAISLIDTDVQVEFQAPKDYVEPIPVATASKYDNTMTASIPSANDKVEKKPGKAAEPSTASPLLGRPGGYRLNGSAPTPAPPSTEPATDAKAPHRTTVVQGQWRYTYELDPATRRRRLVRRDPIMAATKGLPTSSFPGHSLQ